MRGTRKIRQLPEAQVASDGDMFPVSQMVDGIPRTRAMSRGRFVAEIVAAVNSARQGLVDEFAARDRVLEQTLEAVQSAQADNEAMDAQMQATLDALQEPIQWENIMGRPALAPATHTHAWGDITGKPTTFPAASHTHQGLATQVGTGTIAETLLLAVSSGVRKINVPLQGAVVGGNYIVFAQSSTPVGYGILDVVCVTVNQLQVSMIVPALGIGSNINIPVRIVRINT